MTSLLVGLALAATPPVICIDPGHPSEVGIGTQGKKLTEVGVCWKVAQKLESLLVKDGYKVVMTKKAEREMVRNKKRAEVANKANSDLMLRLHCDAGTHRGFRTFYPSKAGKVDGITGPSPEIRKASAAAAKLFHPAVIKSLDGGLRDAGISTDDKTAVGSKQGALTGSIYSKVPVLLVEMAVLTQREDEAFLLRKDGMDRLAMALRAGVRASVAPPR